MSFSTWGERQKSDWKPGNPTKAFLTTNGFTGHDQLDNHNLIHMGGRVYDPGLGRFLSADIYVQSPYNTQSYNRYSYTFNNPLSYTDPTGYSSEMMQYFMNQSYHQSASWSWANGIRACNCMVNTTTTYAAFSKNDDGSWSLNRDSDAIWKETTSSVSFSSILQMQGDGIRDANGYLLPQNVGSIKSLPQGVAFFGVVNSVFMYGRGDADQQAADTYAAKDLLGAGPLFVAGMAGVGGKAKAAAGTMQKASAYSVAFETVIARLGAGTRPSHFSNANKNLLNEMKQNPELAIMIEKLGINIRQLDKSPSGWTWHHVHDRPSVMQLVPQDQHKWGSGAQWLLHPDKKGGFSIWRSQY